MAKTAKDVMEPHVLTVSPETPLIEVQRLFVEEEITGAPVVNEQGRVVGVISMMDLIRAVEEEHEGVSAVPTYYRDQMPYSGPDWGSWPENFQDRLSNLRTEDAMTAGVVSVSPGASIAEVAQAIRKHHIHRVLVLEEEQLVGVISTFDLVALLE